MAELLTAAQMREIERAAIDRGEVTGLELMERAGRGVVDAVLAWRPELAAGRRRAVVLCGPGNNGGDGFVIARLLAARGWSTEVFLYGRGPDQLDTLPPDAAANARHWRAEGAVRALIPESTDRRLCLASNTDLIVDALFGTGLTRPLDRLAPLLTACNPSEMPPDLAMAPIVAVDIPSGLCADSGRPIAGPEIAETPGAAVEADLTVTFHRKKLGHVLGDGPSRCGDLVVADIGLGQTDHPGDLAAEAEPATHRLTKEARLHKYAHGHALVLAGGVGKGGAARLAARGALRVGAGLVTLGCPPAALIENAARLDAIMLTAAGDAAALETALSDRRISALCLGPGLGVARAHALLPAALRSGRPAVLDADALTAIAEAPETHWPELHAGCVLTPHEGEFARLFPELFAKLRAPALRGPAFSKADAAREAAGRAGCTVLLKGPDTVIAAPDGRAAVSSAAYERAAPWLATAGSGDVLAGIIAGLLARGTAPFAAASTGAWLHVEAGRIAGPGLIAEDLPEALPAVFRGLGL